MFGLKRRGVSAAPLRYSGCAPVTATPPAHAASPDAADGEECDSSDDEPHDDVVHSAPPFCSSKGSIPPDAAHYALSPFPCLLEIQRKSNSVPTAITPHYTPHNAPLDWKQTGAPLKDGKLGRPSRQSRPAEVPRSVHRDDQVGRPSQLCRSTEKSKGVGGRFKASGGTITTPSPAALSHIDARRPASAILTKPFLFAVTPHRLIAAEVPLELSPSPQDILNILQYIQGEQGRCALGTYRNMFLKLCNGRSDRLLHNLPMTIWV